VLELADAAVASSAHTAPAATAAAMHRKTFMSEPLRGAPGCPCPVRPVATNG
jgi:hypothetical protein